MPKKLTEQQKLFAQGYVCAICCILKSHGESTELREALSAGGYTSMSGMRRLGVDPFDLEILKEHQQSLRLRN